MTAFLISLLAPALWAVSNHFNKFLVSRYLTGAGVGAVVVFAALIGVLVLPLAFILQQNAFQLAALQALLIALNGCLYLCALTPFLKALRISDASSAIPILQVVPVFSFVLASIFLGETLSANQIIGGSLIVFAAFMITLQCKPGSGLKRFGIQRKALALMLLSSFIYALSFLLFKYFAQQTDFWSTTFWESVGFIGYASALLLFVPAYRKDFFAIFPSNRVATGLVLTNEAINILAKIAFNYFSLWIPLTLAWVGVSFQPVFVLLYSMILTGLFPHINKEAVTGRDLAHKATCIVLMIVGAYVMHR
jgi:drug/metabolite transporter (DMT)-like permease